MSLDTPTIEDFMTGLVRRNPGEPEFHQAVHEVARDIIPFCEANPEYAEGHIFERMTEPDRVVSFHVPWTIAWHGKHLGVAL